MWNLCMAYSLTFALCVLLPGGLAYAAASEATSITSKIDRVTVYTTGATVTRVGNVNLRSGANELSFKGLPSDVDENQVQIAIDSQSSGAALELGQVRFDREQQTDAFSEEVAALNRDVIEVRSQIQAVEDSNQTAQLKLQFLQGLAQGYAKESWFEGARGQADVSSWVSALGVLEEGSNNARQQLRENLTRRLDLDKEMSRLQRELARLNGSRQASMTVTFTVESNRAQTAPISINYFQEAAQWRPRYVARLDSETKQLSLVQRGIVSQDTDERWPGVALTLSTSEPSAELEVQELESLFVDLEVQAQGRMQQSIGLAKARSPNADMLEEIVVTGSRIEAPDVGTYGVTYRVPGRVEISNESDDYPFDLAQFAFDVELVTKVVPEVSTDAFLTAGFTHDGDVPLYGNQMMAYVDNVFIGETWMPTVLPGGKISLPFGQDRRVQVMVRDQGRQNDTSGLFSRRKEERTNLLFEVVNRRASETTVEVYARWPVARNAAIEVEVPKEATTPTEQDIDDNKGVILWRKVLSGEDVWRINHIYDVSYPSDEEIFEAG